MVRKSIGALARHSLFLTAAFCLALASPAAAAVPGMQKFDGADTAWLLLCATLVLMMTIPGLALFYGGMVRRKNVLSTLMQSFILVAIVSIQWVLFGYSLAFSPGSAFIGALSWAGLNGVSASQPYAAYSATVPHQAYMIYQCMFAVITPALITGAIAERMSFKGFLVFSIMWVTLIYDPAESDRRAGRAARDGRIGADRTRPQRARGSGVRLRSVISTIRLPIRLG